MDKLLKKEFYPIEGFAIGKELNGRNKLGLIGLYEINETSAK